MKGTTFNIAFPKDLLHRVDETAAEESRSRSELLREAARLYLERRLSWERIFSFGQNQARRFSIRPADIDKEIRSYRRQKRRA